MLCLVGSCGAVRMLQRIQPATGYALVLKFSDEFMLDVLHWIKARQDFWCPALSQHCNQSNSRSIQINAWGRFLRRRLSLQGKAGSGLNTASLWLFQKESRNDCEFSSRPDRENRLLKLSCIQALILKKCLSLWCVGGARLYGCAFLNIRLSLNQTTISFYWKSFRKAGRMNVIRIWDQGTHHLHSTSCEADGSPKISRFALEPNKRILAIRLLNKKKPKQLR